MLHETKLHETTTVDFEVLVKSTSRPEALPSPYAIIASFAGIVLSACVCSVLSEQGLWIMDLVAFVRTGIVVLSLAVISGATGRAAPSEWSCVSQNVSTP